MIFFILKDTLLSVISTLIKILFFITIQYKKNKIYYVSKIKKKGFCV